MPTLALQQKNECQKQAPREADHELLERAAHCPQALADVYRMYVPRINAYVVRRVGHAADAEDIVANVFLAMVRGLPKYEPGPTPFSAWLYRIATNEINRFLRMQRVRRIFVLLKDEPTCRDPDSEDAEFVRRALQRIPLRFQNVLGLYYLEELSISEVAGVLGIAEGTVKSRLSRGRDRLREVIGKEVGLSQSNRTERPSDD